MHGSDVLRRLLVVGVCVLSVAGSVALAMWQWQRFSTGGSWQNLGYVLQWPLFGLFPAFAFWRLRRLRAEHRDRRAEAPAEESVGPRPVVAPSPSRGMAADVHNVDDTDDPELAAYNRMLARLNARDRQENPQ